VMSVSTIWTAPDSVANAKMFAPYPLLAAATALRNHQRDLRTILQEDSAYSASKRKHRSESRFSLLRLDGLGSVGCGMRNAGGVR
jgi:hypothetical protein